MKLLILVLSALSLFAQTEWFYRSDVSGDCPTVNDPACKGIGLAIQQGAAIDAVKLNGITLDPSTWIVTPNGQMVVKVPFQNTDVFSVLYR